MSDDTPSAKKPPWYLRYLLPILRLIKYIITLFNWGKNWFYFLILIIAIFGGLCAFFIPLIITVPFKDGDTVQALRQAILVTVAGLLTMLTLWENRRKKSSGKGQE